METNELQSIIIKKVLDTHDPHLLNSLQQLLNNNNHQNSLQLSDIKKPVISKSHADYLAGIPNEVLFYQNVNWMSEDLNIL